MRQKVKKPVKKGSGKCEVKVRIDDKAPITSLGIAAGPFVGKMKVSDIIKELRLNPKRKILVPSTGTPYELERLEKYFMVEKPALKNARAKKEETAEIKQKPSSK